MSITQLNEPLRDRQNILKNEKTLLLLSAGYILSGCATIFTGSKKKVTFSANTEQSATLTIDGYKYHNITFPYTVKIRGGFEDTMVQAESDGYEKTQVVINKTFNAVSVLNFFDLLGWGIDAASGAMMKPEYKFYEFEFEKKEE